MLTFNHILCPIDFSETSSDALDHACTLARDLGARLHLLHVCQLPAAPMDTEGMTPMESFENEYVSRFGQQMEQLASRLKEQGLDVETRLSTGIAYDEILTQAEAVNADLIVIGTHGRSGLAHLLIGSVAERVIRGARIPVFTVPIRKPD